MMRTSILFVCFTSTIAIAQPAEPEQVAAATATPDPSTSTATPAPAPMPAPSTGPRLRNGFSLSAGQEFGENISGQLFGVDWRIGAKINDAISAYVSTHLSFGTASQGANSGVTGNLAVAAIGEYELPMRLFVGGGGGWGVLNNPDGPLVQLRAGYYPFKKTSEGKARRLNVALDARWYMTGMDQPGDVGTVTHIALTLGYDRF